MPPLSGLDLARRFHAELVAPWLTEAFPNLRHAAALIGPGSELLGYDDAMSRDHGWGLRLQLFVTEADFAAHARAVIDAFTTFAPKTFHGDPLTILHRPHPAPDNDGALGDKRHGLEVHTLESRLRSDLALAIDEPRDNLTWLGLSEQRLLAFTAGAVFRDDDGRLTALRARLASPPTDVRLYKLAGQWRRIAEEQAFVGRTGLVGDDLGSRIIAARLVRDGMRMACLIEGAYAPYPKWFGTAFARLPCAADLTPWLRAALAADDWQAREAALAQVYLALAKLHRARGLPGAFEPAIGPFHTRPFTVINAEAIGAAIRAEIADPVVRALPVIGALDQVTDATPVIESPSAARRAMAALFDDAQPSGGLEEA